MSTRNLVDYLDQHAPDALAGLRADFPSAGGILRWDRELGETLEGLPAGVGARAALAQAAVAALLARTETMVAALSARLKRAQRLKTGSAVLATIANAGLVASLTKAVGGGSDSVELILASIALAASLLAVFAERAAGGTQVGALFDEAITLATRALRGDQARQRLALGDAGQNAWDALLSDLDQIALDAHTLESKARVA